MVIVRAPLSALVALSLVTITLSLSQEEALLKLKASIADNGALDSWISGKPPCEGWKGVVCGSGIIHRLHLSSMALSGNIDVDSLVEISGLRSINFANNSFSGTIPDFNRLGAVKSLFLSKNKFYGEIPNDFFSKMLSIKKIYLSDNDFSGKIPDSLAKLSHLKELHLEGNKFSGPIPKIKPNMLRSIDLSGNNLTGEIPASLSGFNASAFAENEGLCGKPLNIPCAKPTEKVDATIPIEELEREKEQEEEEEKSNVGTKLAALFIVGLLVVGLFVVIRVSAPPAQETKKVFPGEIDNKEVAERVKASDIELLNVARNSEILGSSKRSSRSSGSGSGRTRTRSLSDEIVMVDDEKQEFGLPDLMKAAAEVLGNGALGSAYKAMMANGLCVVVKRVRDMNNACGKDGFDAEMRRFGKIRHPNVLPLLAYHYRRDEKLLVSEHVPKGSLFYVLHGNRGISHAELNWPTRYKIILGIARGLGFLHTEFPTHQLPHGNLKSSNVLLGENYEPLLSDYAFYPLMDSTQAAQAMFAFKAPECSSQGDNNYVSPKCDVYCLGVIILEVVTGKFPSQYLSNSKGGTDVVQWATAAVVERREEGIVDPVMIAAVTSSSSSSSSGDSKSEMVKLLRIGVACTVSDPARRLDLREAIRSIEEIQV